ncbi:hypothetical protein VTL71DRAFT_14800 [Oculimacula yallundae]|uniref:Uncharacterized protein n=1 Tax=Oculimacula yallundae TaxID=86028 RepID=A0ABR4CK27_9HELO
MALAHYLPSTSQPQLNRIIHLRGLQHLVSPRRPHYTRLLFLAAHASVFHIHYPISGTQYDSAKLRRALT